MKTDQEIRTELGLTELTAYTREELVGDGTPENPGLCGTFRAAKNHVTAERDAEAALNRQPEQQRAANEYNTLAATAVEHYRAHEAANEAEVDRIKREIIDKTADVDRLEQQLTDTIGKRREQSLAARLGIPVDATTDDVRKTINEKVGIKEEPAKTETSKVRDLSMLFLWMFGPFLGYCIGSSFGLFSASIFTKKGGLSNPVFWAFVGIVGPGIIYLTGWIVYEVTRNAHESKGIKALNRWLIRAAVVLFCAEYGFESFAIRLGSVQLHEMWKGVRDVPVIPLGLAMLLGFIGSFAYLLYKMILCNRIMIDKQEAAAPKADTGITATHEHNAREGYFRSNVPAGEAWRLCDQEDIATVRLGEVREDLAKLNAQRDDLRFRLPAQLRQQIESAKGRFDAARREIGRLLELGQDEEEAEPAMLREATTGGVLGSVLDFVRRPPKRRN